MPELPGGEAHLRGLALEFVKAEEFAVTTMAIAANGGRSEALARALDRIHALRRLDYKAPVVRAYLAEHPRGKAVAVRDLAGSLAKRLDHGAKTAADSARATFAAATPANVAQLAAVGITASVGKDGTRWGLGHWATMNSETIGRQSTSRGIADRVGQGRVVTIDVGECQLCAEFAGEAVIGTDPLPPYHPSCTCTASAA